MTNMKAVIANGPKDYKLIYDKPIPKIQDGEVLVKVLVNGICGSDLKMYEGSEFYWGVGGRARRGVIPGHEFIGSVVDIDPSIARDQSISIGDVVVAEQLVACRDQCWFCKNGMEHKCDKLVIYGQGVDGCMAEYMIYQKGSWLHKVPEGLSPIYAVLAEPIAVSVRAMDRAHLKPTDLIVVSGCGTIGLGLIAAIETYYPDVSIIVLDYFQFKLDLAKSIAKKCTTFNLSDKTVSTIADIVRKMSGEQNGADVFFECSGSPDSIKAGFEFVRKCGTFVHIGICKEIHVDAPWNAISAGKELTIIGCNLGRHAWPRAFEILKKCDLSQMITHRLPLEEYSNALNLINSGIKVVLDPTLSAPKLLNDSKSLLPLINNNDEQFKIKDSVAFVTGSSHGIGRAIAIALAKEGAKVIIHGTNHDSPSYSNEGTTMTILAQEISTITNNTQITAVWGDLSTKESVQSVLNHIKYPIDILICCSGEQTTSEGKICNDTCLTISDSDTKLSLNRNFWTTHLVCQSIVPQMIHNHRGHVIIIGSTSALIGREKDALYTVSKAAVHQYMRCLATEVKSSGIRVNCIAPGPTLIEQSTQNIGKEQGIIGKLEHIANAVIHLLNMDFVHGQIIRVDGGEQTFSS
ncbi:unnamed protein product [Rotaria sordida]|uniref:Alcohol dehydrogenase n=1 Tax=Rotaria sordida TaxID=392033 RepID=A0A814YL31_9BILA|nr:unnamed protein product [Rotaria sordida]CAF3878829.1 unnamed protein product [Rotaria sordida]CAF4010015.1 unnamed protein product [Rotaria sordida]